MAYYIYRVFPFGRLEKVTQFDAFTAASTEVKRLRATAGQPADSRLRIIFAENELHAEDLLSQVRQGETGVVGDE
jgi:hypothetical protein